MLIQRQRFELVIKPLGQCVVIGVRCCSVFGALYEETDGVAMGFVLGPLLANNRYKRNLLTTMLDRAYRLSSSWLHFSEECERLRSLRSNSLRSTERKLFCPSIPVIMRHTRNMVGFASGSRCSLVFYISNKQSVYNIISQFFTINNKLSMYNVASI